MIMVITPQHRRLESGRSPGYTAHGRMDRLWVYTKKYFKENTKLKNIIFSGFASTNIWQTARKCLSFVPPNLIFHEQLFFILLLFVKFPGHEHLVIWELGRSICHWLGREWHDCLAQHLAKRWYLSRGRSWSSSELYKSKRAYHAVQDRSVFPCEHGS